jgi:excisionase family DNA binding protein
MTATEAAKLLEVSVATVYELCAAGRLAHHRIGLGRGVIRIDRPDLDAYLASSRVEARPNPPGRQHAATGTGLAVRDFIGEEMAREGSRVARHRSGAPSDA